MTPDERKVYNKTYYESKKQEIIKSGCDRVKCEFCLKIVSKNRLLNHYKTVNCSNRIKLNKLMESKKKEIESIIYHT